MKNFLRKVFRTDPKPRYEDMKRWAEIEYSKDKEYALYCMMSTGKAPRLGSIDI